MTQADVILHVHLASIFGKLVADILWTLCDIRCMLKAHPGIEGHLWTMGLAATLHGQYLLAIQISFETPRSCKLS